MKKLAIQKISYNFNTFQATQFRYGAVINENQQKNVPTYGQWMKKTRRIRQKPINHKYLIQFRRHLYAHVYERVNI